MKKINVKVIRTEEIKIPDKINVELTKKEAMVVMAWLSKAQDYHAEELQNPSRETRRMLRQGKITRSDLRQYYKDIRNINDKFAKAITGLNSDEFEALLKKIEEELK
ncbi:MAG: hypothetical protein IIY54_10615 [Ruminococcus sp.]|nr:hypothetical protein [Ruminococcus sp.]MBQ1310150.1 hypothetical protein [Ruminococcus sp.]